MEDSSNNFVKLMQVANENKQNIGNKSGRCLVTSFKPPKKESRKDATLSAGVKKYLAKKEEELRREREEAEERKRLLLEKRSEDSKALKRVQLMRKSTKSYSKAVIADAVQDTLDAVRQPDEDDYGFSSATEQAMYAKMMQGYASESKNKTVTPTRKPANNLNATKARVREALEREQMEADLPHKRKRRQKQETDLGGTYEDCSDHEEPPPPPKAKKAPPAPIMDFNEILRQAHMNKDRPMLDDELLKPVPVKKKALDEPERLMTKKQKIEYLKEKEFLDRKAERDKLAKMPHKTAPCGQPGLGRIPKIPKLSAPDETTRPAEKSKPEKSSILERRLTAPEKKPNPPAIKASKLPEKSIPLKTKSQPASAPSRPAEKPRLPPPSRPQPNGKFDSKAIKQEPPRSTPKPGVRPPGTQTKPSQPLSKTPQKPPITAQSRPAMAGSSRPPGPSRPSVEAPRPSSALSKSSTGTPRPQPGSSKMSLGTPRLAPSSVKSSLVPQKSSIGPPRPAPGPGRSDYQPRPANGPPRPMMRGPSGNGYLPRPKKPLKKKMAIDSDSEQDSEMDDFIDDTPLDEDLDMSKILKGLFGYDKSKYRDMDDDIDCMESSFHQISKEEFISTKTGMMEDLADIEEKKRRKLAAKKKKLHQR